MPSSTSTPIYALPIFGDDDKPTWRGDVTDTNVKLEEALVGLDAKIDGVAASGSSDTTVANYVADPVSLTNDAIEAIISAHGFVKMTVGGTGLTAKQLDELSIHS